MNTADLITYLKSTNLGRILKDYPIAGDFLANFRLEAISKVLPLPQNPVEGESWEADDLDGFGNLALITVSGNSKFSNLPPEGKITSYPSIIEQSLKLKIMKELVNFDDEKWTEEKARKHKEEMFRVLKG
jgi:hypothetical protein